MTSSDLAHAADLVSQADLLLVAAGAGMGVDSGLPDFRGNQGFWKAYPALAHARMEFTSVASPATFHDDPALAWGFYGHRLNLYRATVPHAGFGLLKKWGERMEPCRLLNDPPRCPHCGALARPNILMFGDSGWNEHRTAAQEARLHRLLQQAERPLVIELGAGVAIPSVRYFGQAVISRYNGRMIRIKPREPQVASPQDVGLAEAALAGLNAIDALL